MICSQGPEVCLVTLGQDGVFITRPAPESFVQTRIEGIPAKVRDTTGCGDVFSAAYICAWNRGCDPVESARQANLAAAKSCECIGLESLVEAIQ
jgi:sugar/nucleoside kinase (ribokinase family)